MCAEETRLIDAYIFNVRRRQNDRAKLARLALQIHRPHCPQCAPVVLRSNFPQVKPRKCDGSLTWKANRRGRRDGTRKAN